MNKEYYQYDLIVKNDVCHCIWYTNEKDGFITEFNKIKYFKTMEEFRQFIKLNSINVNEGCAALSIDQAEEWLSNKVVEIDCEYFLNFWNLISDLANSVEEKFYGYQEDNTTVQKIYDKLFYGNNIPSLVKGNKRYQPKWDAEEIAEIANVIKDGLRIVEKIL